MEFLVRGEFGDRLATTHEVYAESIEAARRIAESAGIAVAEILPAEAVQPEHLARVGGCECRSLHPGIAVFGFVSGGILASALLVCLTAVLWETRTIWFELPNDRDSLQYFDLMILLGLGSAVTVLPAVLMGGLTGVWLASRGSGSPDS
jgi:hypothetical protein